VEQNLNSRSQRQPPLLHQSAVMLLLGPLQRCDKIWLRVTALQVAQLGSDALLPPTDGQPGGIALRAPAHRHTGLGKGLVEGGAMAIALGLGEGAIDIPEQSLERHDTSATR
jgi:hypothetical protein